MSLASANWSKGRVVIADAVTFADGRLVLLDLQRLRLGVPVDCSCGESSVGKFLSEHPGWLADVTTTTEAAAPPHGTLQAGEGSQGSDGFIALTDVAGNLAFCLFSTGSNPFVSVELMADRSTVRAISSAGTSWCFSIDTPWVITSHDERRRRIQTHGEGRDRDQGDDP